MPTIFSNQNKNLLQTILENELVELTDETTANSEEPNNFFKDGNVLFRTIPSRESFINILYNSRIVLKKGIEDYSSLHSQELFSSMTDSIVNINNAGNMQQCLATINSIKKALGKRLYGALLINGEDIINPLHPLTAMSLLSDIQFTSEKINFRLVIYAYKTEELREALFKEYKEYLADVDLVNTNINNQILMSSNKVITEAIEISKTVINEEVTLKYKVKKHPEEETHCEYYITAHQIFTNGIVMPYYGTSVIKIENGETSGMPLTPMLSSNIAAAKYVSCNPISEDRKHKLEWDSVCTGDYPNNTMEGLRTLTHSNASSAYTEAVIAPGALTYAEACITKCLEIYTKAEFFKGRDF